MTMLESWNRETAYRAKTGASGMAMTTHAFDKASNEPVTRSLSEPAATFGIAKPGASIRLPWAG
jgi:hypothetical protein